jgi:hypothetical protein
MIRSVRSITGLSTLLLATMLVAGCDVAKSETPTSPTVAGPIPGVGITAPFPQQPINGQEVLNTVPVQLQFVNSTTNGVRPLYYSVEVSADKQFTQPVFARSKVPPAPGERTMVVVEGKLDPLRTYYWRVRAEDGANSSDYSAVAFFDLVVPVVLGAPSPVTPVGGQTLTTRTPQLRVNNGGVEGRAGDVQIDFFVASDQAFAALVYRGSAGMSASGSTSITTSELPANTVLFWRAYATNGSTTSSASTTQSFRTPAAVVVPVPDPGGGGGGGGTPVDWTTDQWKTWFFDLTKRKGLPNATVGAMGALRADLLANGADWQNGWRGDYRARLFLPVRNCPPASSPTAPPCAYSRPVDVGENGLGNAWSWVVR